MHWLISFAINKRTTPFENGPSGHLRAAKAQITLRPCILIWIIGYCRRDRCIAKTLIRLRSCTNWSMSLLLAYTWRHLSYGVAQMTLSILARIDSVIWATPYDKCLQVYARSKDIDQLVQLRNLGLRYSPINSTVLSYYRREQRQPRLDCEGAQTDPDLCTLHTH